MHSAPRSRRQINLFLPPKPRHSRFITHIFARQSNPICPVHNFVLSPGEIRIPSWNPAPRSQGRRSCQRPSTRNACRASIARERAITTAAPARRRGPLLSAPPPVLLPMEATMAVLVGVQACGDTVSKHVHDPTPARRRMRYPRFLRSRLFAITILCRRCSAIPGSLHHQDSL